MPLCCLMAKATGKIGTDYVECGDCFDISCKECAHKEEIKGKCKACKDNI